MNIQGSAAVGLLAVRILVGMAFIFHGYPKIANPTGWMGTMAFLPPWGQAIVAVVEFFGGIALIAGIVTRLAALLLVCDMLGALVLVEIPSGTPFVGPGHTLEVALSYLAINLLLLLAGPGALSADAAISAGRRARRQAPAATTSSSVAA
ncbi:MAG: DoxX family protein [Candidatus Eremiobacteraeota bacterium]|nr:DoxX family protein [Candidatus Eremiobacteraeota bacterium]MBV8355691.1 DoxX family protein [Candidatus Eremiobacteraeota bacterium]